MLPDHTGRERRLSEIAGGDPLVLLFSRGWWCPKEQRFLRGLVRLQDKAGVAYSKLVVVSTPAGGPGCVPRRARRSFPLPLGAERRYLDELGLRETTDTVHDPYRPAAFTLFPDLRIHKAYNGYWCRGRPTLQEWSGQIGAELKNGLREAPSWIAFARKNQTVYPNTVTAPDPSLAPYYSFLLEQNAESATRRAARLAEDEFPG